MRIWFMLAAVLLLGAGAPMHPWAQESQREMEQLDFAQGLLMRGLNEMAVAEYQKFITEFPQSPSLQDAYLGLGESYFIIQDFPKSAEAFGTIKKHYPDSPNFPTAVLRLGQIAFGQKQYDQAIQELSSVNFEERFKDQLQVLQSFYFYLAKSFRGKGDWSSALNYFQKAAKLEGVSTNTANALQEAGEIYSQNAQYQEAVESYGQAIQAADGHTLKAYLIVKLGETHFLAGEYERSISVLRQIVEKYATLEITKDALANILLGYSNLGQFEQVLAEYNSNANLIKEVGSHFDIHFSAAKALIELKRYEEAAALLNKMWSWPDLKAADRRKVDLKKADILLRQKRFPEAAGLLEALEPGTDGADEAAFLKAQSYYGLGDFEKAGQFFSEVKDNHAGSNFAGAALLGLAHARREAGKYDQAGELFFKFYSSEAQGSLKEEALYYAALMDAKLNAQTQAIARAQEYIKNYPDGGYLDASVLLLADLYGKTNQAEKAVSLLQVQALRASALKRPQAVYFLLGYNQQLLGNTDQALESYSKVASGSDEQAVYVSALKNSAAIQLSRKNDAQAAQLFDRLITEIDKNNLEMQTYLWVCDQYLRQEKWSDVLRVAQKAEQYFPGQIEGSTAYFKAEAWRELKDMEQALKNYDLVLAAPAKSMYTGAAHIGKAMVQAESGKFDEAKAELQKAIEENPEDNTITLRARFELGNVAGAVADWQSALKFFMLIVTIYDDDYYVPESLVRAGWALENLNRQTEALKIYQEVTEKYKDTAQSAQAQERTMALHAGSN